MDKIVKIENVTQYNNLVGVETLHPLITVINLSKARVMPPMTLNMALYAVYLVEMECGEVKYGRNYYDYQDGTMIFTAPGQVVGVEPNIGAFEARGWAMLFHPDLVTNTELGKRIHEYNFFSYRVSEALHLSEKEQQIIVCCLSQIQNELQQLIDKHSKELISTNIDLLLKHCERFYDRQFITRDNTNKGVLKKFEDLLNSYFTSDKPSVQGLPSVSFFAEELHLSANYFGDLVKRETGQTAKNHIQSKVIDIAKDRIFDTEKTVTEIAYELGFKYPQHFMRLFKQKTGIPPTAYRNMN